MGLLLSVSLISLLSACGSGETPVASPSSASAAPPGSLAATAAGKVTQPNLTSPATVAPTSPTIAVPSPTSLQITRETTVPAGVSKVKVANGSVELCGLISQEEVTALFNEPAQPGYFTAALTSCDYYAQNPASRKNLEVTLLVNQTNWSKFKAENSLSSTFLLVDGGIGPQGEEGFALGQLIGPVMYFHKQNVIMSVSLTGLPVDLFEAEKKLAQLIYSRLS